SVAAAIAETAMRGSLTGTWAASRSAASAEPLYTSYRPTTSAMNSVSNVPRSSSWASSVQYSSVLYSCARLAGCRHSPVVWCVTHVMSKALRMRRSDTCGSPVGVREPADGGLHGLAQRRNADGEMQGFREGSHLSDIAGRRRGATQVSPDVASAPTERTHENADPISCRHGGRTAPGSSGSRTTDRDLPIQ